MFPMATTPGQNLSTTESKRRVTATPSDAPSSSAPRDLNSPEFYINRELSLLEFQNRVFDEAQDPENPLLERVKFLSILSSNLDEFFMVRVAGLQKQMASGSTDVGVDGRSASEQLEVIRPEVRRLVQMIQDLLRNTIRPALEKAGIVILEYGSLEAEERKVMNAYFVEHVFPVLTPLASDPGRPFPHISTRSLNLAVVVGDKQGAENFARIKVPDTLPRLVPVPSATPKGKSSVAAPSPKKFVLLEQLIAANLPLLFPGTDIVEAYPFRVTRDAEMAIQELESDDLLESVEEAIRQRRFSSAVRLQVAANMSDKILEILTSNLGVDPQDAYRIDGSIGLGRLIELYALDRPDLKDKPFVPFVPASMGPDAEEDMFALIRRDDILLHHPFESFQPVVDFLRQAAHDPNVLAIKMTLYRVGHNSPIVSVLLEAIEKGKQVAVLVELKARFDEESNVEWARTLEDAGAHVVYGLVGYKVHSKIALVVRREGENIRRYVHLGTGNYNPSTARLYTDFGLLTCNAKFADDATHFFNALTGYSKKEEPRKLLLAPINLRQRLEELIRREIALQAKGERGHLIFKMNALEDPRMIRLLYEASQAGVKVDLLVRGLCCLRPGISGVSENIRVISVVGRFLEHSRVFYFRNGGAEEIYLGSADLMRRNLSHRVEIAFPVENPKLVRRLKETLNLYLSDEKKARFLQSDGTYIRSAKAAQPDAVNSQARLLALERVQVKSTKGLPALGRKRRIADRRANERPKN
jgi:polyphosphate kinase